MSKKRNCKSPYAIYQRLESTGQAVAQNAKTNCEGSLYIIFTIGQGVATVKSCEIIKGKRLAINV